MALEVVNYNKKKYLRSIEAFECKENNLNILLKELERHYCSAKLLINEDVIIAYCAYRCYSVSIEEDIFPAIEVRGFAVDKKYGGVLTNGKTIAMGFFDIMRNEFSSISEKTIKAKYICLHAINHEKVINFYKKIGFEELTGKVLEDEFNKDCKAMFIKVL